MTVYRSCKFLKSLSGLVTNLKRGSFITDRDGEEDCKLNDLSEPNLHGGYVTEKRLDSNRCKSVGYVHAERTRMKEKQVKL